MLKIKRKNFLNLNDKDLIDWNCVIENSSDATIFHTSEWVKLLVEEVGVDCEILFAYKNNKVVGIFSYYLSNSKIYFKKATTSAFETPYGGPIAINDTNNNVAQKILQYQFSNLKILKSKIVLPPEFEVSIIKKLNYKISTRATLEVSLNQNKEDLWSNLHKMKIRNIKKAKKNNIIIKESGIKNISDFHQMLKETYKRLELPPPIELNFYTKLFKLLEPLNRVKLYVAYKDKKPISSAIFLLFNNVVIYWQGASYAEYMKFAPNDLIHWSIIKKANVTGFKKYNMLHFHDSHGNEITSLKNYKMSFGAKLIEYHIATKNSRFNSLLTK